MHTTRLRVRYAECDMQGHAFNANYLTWFDIAHTEALRSRVGSYNDVVARGVELLVLESRVRYRAPARFDDLIDVTVAFEEPGRTSLVSRFTVTRDDGGLVAEGELVHVCVDAASFEKLEWPAWLRDALGAG